MIITISGQYGSGGNEIGQALAERLGYRILDSQLVARARELFVASRGGERPVWWPSRYDQPFCEEDDLPVIGTAYDQARFKLRTDLLDSSPELKELGPEADEVRKEMLEAQSKAILEYTEGGNCVVLGKCSNFVLRGQPGTLHVFTTAELESRIKRIRNLYNLTMDKVTGSRWTPPAYALRNAYSFLNMSRDTAVELIQATDQRRASIYEFITGEQWGGPQSYDLLLDGSDKDLTPHVDRLAAEVAAREAAL
jgi:hypothetical protein